MITDVGNGPSDPSSILDKAVCISRIVGIFEKGINLFLTMDK